MGNSGGQNAGMTRGAAPLAQANSDIISTGMLAGWRRAIFINAALALVQQKRHRVRSDNCQLPFIGDAATASAGAVWV